MSSQSISPEERLRHLEGYYADRVTAFRQRLAHLGLSRVLIVLLDIGKNVHWATASLASGLELVRPHRLLTTKVGLICRCWHPIGRICWLVSVPVRFWTLLGGCR
jgi:hypothetical protein